jgi:hypothetical protein
LRLCLQALETDHQGDRWTPFPQWHYHFPFLSQTGPPWNYDTITLFCSEHGNFDWQKLDLFC